MRRTTCAMQKWCHIIHLSGTSVKVPISWPVLYRVFRGMLMFQFKCLHENRLYRYVTRTNVPFFDLNTRLKLGSKNETFVRVTSRYNPKIYLIIVVAINHVTQLTITKRWRHVDFTVTLCEPKLYSILATRSLTCQRFGGQYLILTKFDALKY